MVGDEALRVPQRLLVNHKEPPKETHLWPQHFAASASLLSAEEKTLRRFFARKKRL